MAKRRKTVLITGASNGIGAATAVAAATAGFDVGLGYNSDWEAAEQLAEQIAELGGKTVLLQGDIADPEIAERVFAEFDEAFEELDVLINNAGVVDQAARVEEMDHKRLCRMFDVNTIAPFLCAGHAVLRMARRYGGEGGVIVNVSSIAPRLGSAGQYVDYAATKGALDVMTKGLADEVAADGIRVVGVSPGIIDTDIHAKGGRSDRAEKLAASIPMERAGTADEVAKTILWLMSDAASYITGTTVDVSGGR